ncbi:MAG TPA: NAD-dependent epimerase/dehydratase family protein [Kiritimatiellia bacterium]|nr:NAD-dependent epimerase/dehydratase family protein [Kiritimatiellia bacterium]
MISENILDHFKGSKCIVTGGTGMIGREVVKILCDAGARVHVVSLDKICVDERAEHVLGDLCDFNLCKQLTKTMDFVFHVAGEEKDERGMISDEGCVQ